MNDPFASLTTEALRRKACHKWQKHPEDVLPLWVADMDFPVAEPIKEAIRRYLPSDNFGYSQEGGLPGLREALTGHLETRHGWQVSPEHLLLLNGIVPGLFLSVLALSSPGEDVLMNTPVYGPFLKAARATGRRATEVPMQLLGGRWQLDLEGLEEAVTPATRILMLCNPHNPLGRVFEPSELEALAELALEHRLWVVSDELHADLVFSGSRHLPFASLSSEIAERTVTLLGPTKAFNIAGLKIGFAASRNPQLLRRLEAVAAGLVSEPNVLAQVAALAAYREGREWLEGTVRYLEANRDFMKDYLKTHLPQVGFVPPEGTYLAWLDLRLLEATNTEEYLLEHAKVALNDGAWFGLGGAGFARLNFATSRGILEEAFHRLAGALAD